MRKILLPVLVALPVLLSSCGMPYPRQAFNSPDNSALIVASFDNRTCQIIAPAATSKEESSLVLNYARRFDQHQTAVIIL